MKVSITLPASAALSMPAVQQALASYLFEAEITTA